VKLLAWETATEHVSVALWVDGNVIERALPAARGASDQLLEVIQQLLAEAGLGLQQLDLLAVGQGPGGFTGVRLGISIAQGLGYSTGLPVVPVSTLRAVAQDALQRDRAACDHAAGRLLVCQDARMGEVYCGAYTARDGVVSSAGNEYLAKPADIVVPDRWMVDGYAVCGSMPLGPAVLPALQARIESARPSATAVALLAAHEGMSAAVATAAVQPVYLRNDVAVPSVRT
jgi:tRNA threonylcarbamoyladenosine biosynthesis protein TsaB